MSNLIQGQKKYSYAVSKLEEIGESVIGKMAQSTILRHYNETLKMMQMNEPRQIDDYIVEEQMTEPRLFIFFGPVSVPFETLWNVKNKQH